MGIRKEDETISVTSNEATSIEQGRECSKEPYDPPRILKKHSVTRVTLFSGGVATATTITGNG